MFRFVCLFSSFLSLATAVIPSPSSLRSSVTILTHNDLYGNESPRQAAALVLNTRQSYSEAESSCASLGETLWNSGSQPQDLGFLRYLDHGKTTDDVSVYWIGSRAFSSCRTINTQGQIRAAKDCNLQYPALCSQSAVLSEPGRVDTGNRWQISVRTGNNATIIGYRDKLSFRFLGLRYGTIPARFSYSEYSSPTGNTSALSYGPDCFQNGCGGEPKCSEACLYLNIWTPHLPLSQPSRDPNKKKAVMLWIHGGGFEYGQGSDPVFDGSNLASRGDVVVVTMNYRLSTLGFLAVENSEMKGNYWLSDQITALDWIRTHIEDFGGDKDRITVFGQSAGAASVRALIASPMVKGNFKRAILMSNPAGLQYAEAFSKYKTIAQASEITQGILSETGCNHMRQEAQLSCLRAQDAQKLVGSPSKARYPVIDGVYLTSDGLQLDESAPKTDVTLMMGVMRDDGSPFTKWPKPNATASQALAEQGFNSTSILASDKFPFPQTNNSTMDIFNLTSRVATDAMFRCLTQSTAAMGTKNAVFPAVYSYEIDRGYQLAEYSPNPPACEALPSGEYYRCHSGELYYVFGNLVRQGRVPRDGDDVPFSQYLVDMWTAFAREGDPNPLEYLEARGYSNTTRTAEKAGPWKKVDAGKPTVRVLDVNVRDEGFREVDQCDVLGLGLDYYERLQ